MDVLRESAKYAPNTLFSQFSALYARNTCKNGCIICFVIALQGMRAGGRDNVYYVQSNAFCIVFYVFLHISMICNFLSKTHKTTF